MTPIILFWLCKNYLEKQVATGRLSDGLASSNTKSEIYHASVGEAGLKSLGTLLNQTIEKCS